MDDEYYSTIYAWFERCGIISHMRTQLRQNLVNALKSKGHTLRKENTLKCAKQYVHDLLIAEYLLNRNYDYTLSVFASEAPLLINLQNTKEDTPEGTKYKLEADYVFHILETLGINPTGPEGYFIIDNYLNNDIPLLLSILTTPVSMKEKSVRTIGIQTDFDCTDKVQLIKEALLQQKDEFDEQLKVRERELKEQAIAMEQQLVLLNEKLGKGQNLMQLLSLKEKELEQHISQKETELSFKEKFLLQEAERLQKEKDSYRRFESDLKKLQEELTKVQKDLPQTNPVCDTKDLQVQTDFANCMKWEKEIQTLTKEKGELLSLVEEQKSRIEQLNLRVVQLSRKLEEIQSVRSVEVPSIRTSSMVVSESSSTEDILQDARMRLKKLEEESLKADRYYYNCISSSP